MVNSSVELVVVSGLQMFSHLQAALVYAADVDRYFIQAKTCNYFSQDRTAADKGWARFQQR